MSRYQTFVVRLWVDDEGAMSHGEVRHLGSGAASRFREVHLLAEFIEQTISRRDELGGSGQPRNAREIPLDFERLAP